MPKFITPCDSQAQPSKGTRVERAEARAPNVMLHVPCRKILGSTPYPLPASGMTSPWAEERREFLVPTWSDPQC